MATSRARKQKVEQITLADLVAATETAQGFMWCVPGSFAELVAQGFAEANPDEADVNSETGEIQVAATAEGVVQFNQTQTKQEPAPDATPPEPVVTPVAKPKAAKMEKIDFVIEDDVAMPDSKRGGRSGTKYPFEKLEKVGQSFVIPATDERPNPVKALGSTVSAANKRAAGAAKYAVRADEKGARIFRVA